MAFAGFGLMVLGIVIMVAQAIPVGLRIRRESIQRRKWELWRAAHDGGAAARREYR